MKDFFVKKIEKYGWTEKHRANHVLFEHDSSPSGHSIYLNIGGFLGKPVEI